MEINCTLETRTSKKGNDYKVLVVHLSPRVEKLVFLTDSELELLALMNSKK